MQVQSKPDSGCERFISIEVELTSESAAFDPNDLDRIGRREFDRHVQGRPYRAVTGMAAISWKSPSDRQECMQYQTARRGNRWQTVLAYAALISARTMPPGGPVLLHPSLTGAADGKLQPIDGARRLMACLEAGLKSIPVVVFVSGDLAGS